MSKKKWYERQEISRINQDWVTLNCKNITKREKDLLRIINDRKLVRRDHLEIIHESYRKSGIMRTNIINRSIKKLFEKMCLDKVHEESEFMKGNLPAVLALDRAGAIVLGLNKKFKRRIKHNEKIINGKQSIFRELPNNYPHIHGINELEVQMILLCEELGISISKWDLEEKNAKIIMFNERFVLIPDIFMILRIGKRPFIAFLEYDTGKEDNRHKDKFPTIRDKLEKYQKYKSSGSWKKEKWAKYSSFPMLIFVTEDKKRISYVNEKGKKLGLKILSVQSSDFTNNLISILRPLLD